MPTQNERGKYDHLSLRTALSRAWDDLDVSPRRMNAMRIRVRAAHPALARVLDRYDSIHKGLGDPADRAEDGRQTA